MKEKDSLTVQKDAVHVLVATGRFFRARSHFERSQKAANKSLHLLHILLFGFHHLKDETAVEKKRRSLFKTRIKINKAKF